MLWKWLVCTKCGYEGKIQVLSPEEQQRIQGQPVRCPKCQSGAVSLHD